MAWRIERRCVNAAAALMQDNDEMATFNDAAIAQRIADLLNRDDAERHSADAETPGPGRPCAAAMLWQQGGTQ